MLIAFVVLAGACGGGQPETQALDSLPAAAAGSDPQVTDDAAGRGTDPERGAEVLLAELGSPDSFVIESVLADGAVSRKESWFYYDALTQIDLIDGVILWRIAIDPLADGAYLPFLYEPTEFEMGESLAQIAELLDPVAITELAAADELGYEGVVLYGAEQLLLGFAEDQLVYVESFPLPPEEAST